MPPDDLLPILPTHATVRDAAGSVAHLTTITWDRDRASYRFDMPPTLERGEYTIELTDEHSEPMPITWGP